MHDSATAGSTFRFFGLLTLISCSFILSVDLSLSLKYFDMPSFAFWKNGKVDDATASAVESQTRPTPVFDLDTKNQDSGVFTFEDMELLAECTPTTPLQKLMERVRPSAGSEVTGQLDADAAVLDDEHIESQCGTPELESIPERANHLEQSQQMSLPTEPVQRIETGTTEPPSRPASFLPTDSNISPKPPSSFSARRSSATTTPPPPQHEKAPTRRLHRPTELNLGNMTSNPSKPQSELEKQFDLMRNSKTQAKAALRSPTQLLKQRLSTSSGSEKRESKVHAFVPPQPLRNGCLMPGPAGQMASFASTSVRARTQGGRPAWWCKTDKLVVFDGIDLQDDGTEKVHTRTSKGLSIARRRGDIETIIVPMTCAHCQDMLHRTEWKQEVRVCRRSVCWDCKERSKWEMEQENKERAESTGLIETNEIRERADSVLQDDSIEEEDMLQKVGIEQWRPKSPIEAVGSIEGRMRW